MDKFIKLGVLAVVFSTSFANLPLDNNIDIVFRNDDDLTTYRLPEVLDPEHYDVEITPYFEATQTREAFTFDGIVTINFTAQADGISEITIHENVREILGVTVTDANGLPLPLDGSRPFARLRNYQFLTVYLRNDVTLVRGDNYVLRVVYIGNINETPLSRGVFRGSYIGSDGRRRWYAASHLQPTHSRQAFPSFDEPGFKSTITIIVNRPANFTDTYSNMNIAQRIPVGDRIKEIFHPTPKMSAYLVSIHISEEFTVIADNNNTASSYRILARPNAQGQGNYALEVGPPLTAWLETYLGVPYYTMGEDMKNDQIAVPDWASGATENWGLVSYRELRLLFENGETNSLDKMTIGTITAHELAHKWFGNLVTCRWWNNVWINEGYASYFEYFAMDAVDPSLELEDQFNIMYVHSSLSADSSASTRALEHAVNTPDEVSGHFSGISYSKGATLLLMLKHFLTEDTFRKGLNYYLVEMAYEFANPEDVYRGFARAVQEDGTMTPYTNIDITSFLEYWVLEPGYPVLNVDTSDDSVIRLNQERFFISATAAPTDQVWPLPITYTTETNSNWESLRPSFVMITRDQEISKTQGDEWVIFNVKQKYHYRVNYDDHNWNLISAALKTNLNSIHYLNRAQIVDDIFAFMRSERMSYQFGFSILEFLRNETSYFVWYPALTGWSWYRSRLTHLPRQSAAFNDILNNYVNAVISDVGYDVVAGEPLTRTLNRLFILSFACNNGHEGCVNDARNKFDAFYRNGASVDPNLRRHVFCEGLRNGGYDEWRFIYQRRLSSNNQADEVAMLRALGCTNNERAIYEYLEGILSDDVKAQDRLNAFTFIFNGGSQNARVVLQFLKQRSDDIRNAVIGSSRFASVISNMAASLDEEGLNDFEQWLAENQSFPEYSVGVSSISSARANIEWGRANADIILDAAYGSSVTVVPTIAIMLMALLAHLIVDPNLRRHVFCEGLRNGGYDEWRFIYQRRLSSNNQADEVAMLRALGCTNNERAIYEYLEGILSDDVKAQDRLNAFTFIFNGGSQNARVVLQFLKQRSDDIRNAVIGSSRFASVISNMAASLDEEGLNDFEQWLAENQSFPEYSVGVSSISSARANIEWGRANADIILDAAYGSSVTVVPTIAIMLMALLAHLIVDPNLRRHVFCEGLRNGGYDEWRFIYQRRLSSNNQADEVAMLRALGCTNNERAIYEYLEGILSDDVKAQDRLNAFTFIFNGGSQNARVVLQFLKQRSDDIRNAVIGSSRFASVISNMAASLDEEGLNDFEQWLAENQSFPEYSVGVSSISSARANIEWGRANADIILDAAYGSSVTVVPTIAIMLMALLAHLM